MKQIKKICVFIPIGLVLLAENAIQVYTPNDQIRKPTTYTSGTKTYRKPSGEVQFHQNYRRVLHQNHANYIERQVVLVYKKRRQTSKIEVFHECPEGVTGQFVYDLSCNQFLNCWKGRGYIQNCAPGTLFNPKTLVCDFAQKVECITGPRYNSLGLQKFGKIVEQIGCPKEFSGLIPDYRNCAKFINCANGIEHRMDCAPGTVFDFTKNICDYEHKVVCFNGQNRNEAYTKVDTKLDFGGTSSKSQNYEKATVGKYDYSSRKRRSYDQHFHQESGTINNRNRNVVCPPGAVGIVKHPFDCSKFLNCANGLTFIQDCAPGTLFNPSLGNCDFPQNVKCDQHGTEKCSKDYWQCDTAQECLPLAFVCDGQYDCSDKSDEANRHCHAPTEIRLVNGANRFEGRVEIRHYGAWGTICDDDFNIDAAKVVCKSLGFKGSATVKKEGYFGPGTGPIWLDQVFCGGNESSIEFCTHWNWGEHNCEHNEDVGVICTNSPNSKIEDTEGHSSIVELPLRSVGGIYPDRCGYRKNSIFNRNDNVHFRVVKGSIAERGMYPWQAAIRVKGKSRAAHWCGAVVISEKFVLTAAHCLIGYSKGAYVIVAGDYNVDEDEGTEQKAFIEDFYIHEDFRKGHTMNNDIAVIKLKGRGFRLTDDVQAICLPDKYTPYVYGMNCTISGFGTIESGKAGYSHDLRAGWIPMQSRMICTMPHVYGDNITDGMICAGSLDEGIDTCDGDSGGPLACLNNDVFTLFGITSWGHNCGYANKPGVYVKISYYRKWIDDTISKYLFRVQPKPKHL